MKSSTQQMVTVILSGIVLTLFLMASGKALMSYSYQRIKAMESNNVPVITITNL